MCRLLRLLPEFHLGRRVGPGKAAEQVAGPAAGPDLRGAHVEGVVESRGCGAGSRGGVARGRDGAGIGVFGSQDGGHAPVVMG